MKAIRNFPFREEDWSIFWIGLPDILQKVRKACAKLHLRWSRECVGRCINRGGWWQIQELVSMMRWKNTFPALWRCHGIIDEVIVSILLWYAGKS